MSADPSSSEMLSAEEMRSRVFVAKQELRADAQRTADGLFPLFAEAQQRIIKRGLTDWTILVEHDLNRDVVELLEEMIKKKGFAVMPPWQNLNRSWVFNISIPRHTTSCVIL
jgi:hypothetical protein